MTTVKITRSCDNPVLLCVELYLWTGPKGIQIYPTLNVIFKRSNMLVKASLLRQTHRSENLIRGSTLEDQICCCAGTQVMCTGSPSTSNQLIPAVQSS